MEWISFGILCPTTMIATTWSIFLVLRLKTILLLEFSSIQRRISLSGLRKSPEFPTQGYIYDKQGRQRVGMFLNFRHAVHVSLYFATHFVNQARKSSHRFKDR
jgi:hypothetical protein